MTTKTPEQQELPPGHGNFSVNEPPGSDVGGGGALPPDADAPVLVSLDPDGCVIGDPDFTLFLTGTGFYPASVIHFAGHDEPTTLNADGTLSTGVKPSLWAAPVVVAVAVRNGEVYSDPLDFIFAETPALLAQTRAEGFEYDNHEDDDDDKPKAGKPKAKKHSKAKR